ncbi:MAG TPA: class I SAM-dependent methyltransferase [Alphaproteobacteria bacterium]|nr:class I SAM-dependent methyltransferase [Alphaproteobacteria bacterium]
MDPTPDSSTGQCQVCGAANRAPFIEHQAMTLVRCSGCGFVFMDPMPDEATRAALYDDAYGGTREGYFAKVDSKMRRSRRRVATLARLVPRRGDGSRPRLLDVGANGGFMTEAAREAGFVAVGVEIDPASVAYARTHYPANEFFEGPIETYREACGGTSFDAVYCSEVIEHVADLNPFVAAIAALMRRGAVLYMTTPDIGHWRRPRDLTQWDGFCPPSHCVYFDAATLDRLLRNHGLEIFRKRFSLKPGLKVLARKA